MENKEIKFIADRYKKGRFSTDKAWNKQSQHTPRFDMEKVPCGCGSLGSGCPHCVGGHHLQSKHSSVNIIGN